MRINNNVMALNAHRQLGVNQGAGAKSMERLSSGLRINRAGDDAAGLAISEKMRGQIRGLKQAGRNAQDGISLLQTAEGALNETHAILQRMRELATQSANDTNIAADRSEIQKEIDELAKEITRIANNTEFNTQTLLNGGIKDDGLGVNKFHIGANQGQNIELSINAMDAKSLGVARDVVSADVSDATNVTGADVGTTTGAAVIDNVIISVTTAKVDATEASVTGENAHGVDGTNDLTGITNAALSVTIGDTVFSADNAEIAAWGKLADADALIDAVSAIKDGDGNALSSVANITVDTDNKLVITSKTAGVDESIAVSVTAGTAGGGTDAVNLEVVLGIGSPVVDNGSDVSYTVTFDNNGGTTVDVTGLDGTETSILGTDAFEGLSLVTDGAFNENLAATVTISLDEATAATFADGETTAAVTEAGIDVSSQVAASDAIKTIDTAIEKVSAERSMLGAIQNRLEHTIANLGTSAENLQAAESRIRDLDMAEEIMAFTKNNILQQAATAMLAQANMAPQSVLQLLG